MLPCSRYWKLEKNFNETLEKSVRRLADEVAATAAIDDMTSRLLTLVPIPTQSSENIEHHGGRKALIRIHNHRKPKAVSNLFHGPNHLPLHDRKALTLIRNHREPKAASTPFHSLNHVLLQRQPRNQFNRQDESRLGHTKCLTRRLRSYFRRS